MTDWAQAPIDERIGLLLEVVDTLYREHLFDIVNAVMHTAGQSFNMAYAGSGVNALDRAIEALVYAHQAQHAVAPQARWERQFGPSTIVLDKTYRLVPRGVAVCFSCASFPTWNAWPSMMASLATGNAVIVKPKDFMVCAPCFQRHFIYCFHASTHFQPSTRRTPMRCAQQGFFGRLKIIQPPNSSSSPIR
jgi:acyl-CoA reductase-like NAD-dependent aldehyde dehydrogenase